MTIEEATQMYKDIQGGNSYMVSSTGYSVRLQDLTIAQLQELVTRTAPDLVYPVLNDYWGVCPTCHKNNGYINVGRSHWFFCKEHKVCWCIGVNLFSPADGETLETQEAAYNELGMQNYKEVEPHRRELSTSGLIK